MSGTRNCCFTRYFTDDLDFDAWKLQMAPQMEKFKRFVAQLERCPESGRLHAQGYAEAKTTKSWDWWKKRIGNNPHVTKRRESATKAWNYCLKVETRIADSTPAIFGTPSEENQGKRTDLDELAADIEKAPTLSHVIRSNPAKFLLYGRYMKELFWFYAQEKLEAQTYKPLTINVYWGDTGTGKTRRAHYEAKALGIKLFRKPDSGNWCDGYLGQGGMLLDDFYGQISPGLLLKMLDGYAGEPLSVKGGFAYASYTHVWITSNKDPKEWWANLRAEDKITP